jgi:hypothetical protein
MNRRSSRKPATTLSVFPFLDALVCTMGALIVILVTVVQQARVGADSIAETKRMLPDLHKEELAELRLAKEDQEWRRSELERQRAELQQKAAQQRLELSHFEDHIRRLQEKWRQLQSQAQDLKRVGSQQAADVEETAKKLDELQIELSRRRELLAKIQQESAGKERAFAIIPYDGPNGTKRRPIYIECTDQGIVLQPEGIVLSPSDFEGSLGPGNPLDAALRTTREFLAKYSTAREEPYPLLVVRPNGTVAYAVARAALKSWDDEFGYELIDADMKLAYPKPDSTLKAELERSIADARQRQSMLASMMPGRYKASGFSGLVATTSGGFQPVGGSPPVSRGTGSLGNNGIPAQGGSFSNTFREAMGNSNDRGLTMQAAQQSPGKTKTGTSTGGLTKSGPTPQVGNPASGIPNGNAASGQTTFQPTSHQPGTLQSAIAKPGEPGEPAKPGQPKSNASGQAKGSSRKAPPGAQPLAQERGSDWGLPNRGPTSTGIQRSIQIQCLPDRLFLLQEAGDYRPPTVIPMPNETTQAVDPMVSAIWKRIGEWGIAGDNCYWKPILRVQVAPDAEWRFAELSTLLDGSGLVIERKN